MAEDVITLTIKSLLLSDEKEPRVKRSVKMYEHDGAKGTFDKSIPSKRERWHANN